MKPVAVFRFSRSEGPGYLAQFLASRDIPWEVIRVDEGAAIPADPQQYSGIAMMGGPMSVNDPLPWIAPLLELIRRADAAGVPMIGHCLGGQLMSKAFGGSVTDNTCHEMGWQPLEVVNPAAAADWLGDIGAFVTFQWHYQTFSIPAGATRVLRNDYCENQAYVMGKHIGFQCHIEMTAELVQAWCAQDGDEIRALAAQPSVQRVEDILSDLDSKVGSLNRVADRIYTRWVGGLKA